jgi:hypothetical protein
MKKIFFFFLFSFSLLATDGLVPRKLTWKNLNELEIKMQKWVASIGEKDLIALGKMRQRPEEAEIVRTLFPYLLPKDFFAYELDMKCYPAFLSYQKNQSKNDYKSWSDCVNELYGEKSIPELSKKALNDLAP